MSNQVQAQLVYPSIIAFLLIAIAVTIKVDFSKIQMYRMSSNRPLSELKSYCLNNFKIPVDSTYILNTPGATNRIWKRMKKVASFRNKDSLTIREFCGIYGVHELLCSTMVNKCIAISNKANSL